MSSPSRTRLRGLVGGEPARSNDFGLGIGLGGLLFGWVFATLLIDLWPRPGGAHHALGRFDQDLCSLVGLWIGLLLAVGAARGLAHPRRTSQEEPWGDPSPGHPRPEHPGLRRAGSVPSEPNRSEPNRSEPGGYLTRLRRDYGIAISWIDLPIGVAAGLVSQYMLTPIFELPLLPFVPHLYARLNAPATSLTQGVTGVRFAVLGLFICLGSPMVEELYFRGLMLRALLGRAAACWPGGDHRALAVGLPVVASAIFFGLVHFEPLEFLALAGFGVVLALLAYGTGRLGPGFVAHVTFNSATVIALAHAH